MQWQNAAVCLQELYVLCIAMIRRGRRQGCTLQNVAYEFSKRIVARKMLQFSMFEWWRNF